ncbi:hypothetical protein GCM10012285_24550 [Streptomyces kronopolitis]|uniref:DUF3263 domain-containing protein n=1 Tax=Streptomyces kronopolitis TaxID=1612435 RepID=A0ABQ2JEG4_9ACTN|nr:hypothetical protein [Streptomyces kronopolitis]GGN43282.1 hypothetical protein GCM10012285_24550 [Streptomyces kronopolitis]
MTGPLRCCSPDEPLAAHGRLVLTLDDIRSLRYRDQRKLQGVRWADALAVDRAELTDLLARRQAAGRRGAVESALMDQALGRARGARQSARRAATNW